MVFILVLASVPAHAMLPPLEFDRAYHGKLTVVWLNRARMFWTCWGSISCAYGGWLAGSTACTIYLPNFKTRDPKWMIRRHEIGHCNGWPAHHPGAR